MKLKIAVFFIISMALFQTTAICGLRSGDGRKTVTTAGTAEALSATDTPLSEITMCAEANNTGVIAVGDTPIAALATREGIYLDAGDCYTISYIHETLGNLTAIKIDTTVDGDGVTFHWNREER